MKKIHKQSKNTCTGKEISKFKNEEKRKSNQGTYRQPPFDTD